MRKSKKPFPRGVSSGKEATSKDPEREGSYKKLFLDNISLILRIIQEPQNVFDAARKEFLNKRGFFYFILIVLAVLVTHCLDSRLKDASTTIASYTASKNSAPVVIGSSNIVNSGNLGENAISISSGNLNNGNQIAIGLNAEAGPGSIAIGHGAKAGIVQNAPNNSGQLAQFANSPGAIANFGPKPFFISINLVTTNEPVKGGYSSEVKFTVGNPPQPGQAGILFYAAPSLNTNVLKGALAAVSGLPYFYPGKWAGQGNDYIVQFIKPHPVDWAKMTFYITSDPSATVR